LPLTHGRLRLNASHYDDDDNESHRQTDRHTHWGPENMIPYNRDDKDNNTITDFTTKHGYY